jgi:hypothetical protein
MTPLPSPEDDLATLGEEILRDLLADGHVVEAAGVLHQHRGLGVGGLHARAEAGLELLDEGDLHAADEADLLLGHEARQRADQEAAFFFLEDDGAHVGEGDGSALGVEDRAVDEQELGGRVGLGDGLHGVLEREAGADGERGALVDEELEVGLVVLLDLGLDDDGLEGDGRQLGGELRREARVALGGGERLVAAGDVLHRAGPALQAAQGAVVEGLVAAAADVGDDADGEGLGSGRHGRVSLAGGQAEAGAGEQKQGGLHDAPLKHGGTAGTSEMTRV